MKQIFIVLIISIIANSGCAQQVKRSNKTLVGGACEGCEAIYESPVPFNKLSWADTLPDFDAPGPKMMISGTIYKRDGKTPASNVVMYVYQTNQEGRYGKKGNETGWGLRHGYIRGWVRTNDKGQYRFYTLRPAAYPGGSEPAHIHATIKEPEMNEYYIDDFQFDNDPLLTSQKRKLQQNRGGNGILKLQQKNGMLVAERNIVLGKNVTDYPASATAKINSGLAIGSNCPAFDPVHVSGPDKGTTACPMCKYGYGQGIMVWWNNDNLAEMAKFTKKLDEAIAKYGLKKLRAFIVFMNPGHEDAEKLKAALTGWSAHTNIRDAAIVFIPSPTDPETAGLYAINPAADNTIFVYKKRRVVHKIINYTDTDANYSKLLRHLIK